MRALAAKSRTRDKSTPRKRLTLDPQAKNAMPRFNNRDPVVGHRLMQKIFFRHSGSLATAVQYQASLVEDGGRAKIFFETQPSP